MRTHTRKPFYWLTSLLVAVAMFGISCQQYEYSSPGPGILELRLAVKNTRENIIPFNDFSFLNIVIRDMAVLRNDGTYLIVLADLQAIQRKENGDTLNCITFAARDSQIVLGQVYAPPGTYVGLGLDKMTAVVHDPFLLRFDGNRYTPIAILDVGSAQKFTMLAPPPPFEVRESRKTIVTFTLDLDQSMPRRTEWFEWVAPLVYISSIQYL
ncbi:MAG: hypothetical protein KF749_01120 [Bacteroidetes bacterium]|nr:hypothetical protein [Bacteroidota bacterium]MCW5896113.1 hypothetical protein [Bacteroidota bacterium]